MHRGSLSYNEYKECINAKIIYSKNFRLTQLQPSSMDLTLSKECYQICSSFLSPNTNVKNKLKNFKIRKIKIDNGYVFKKNVTYLIIAISLFYYSFNKARKKGTLINIGE